MPYNKKFELSGAELVKPGDLMVVGKQTMTVESVEVKVKYVYIMYFEDTDKYQIERASSVTVWRKTATPMEDYESGTSRFVNGLMSTIRAEITDRWPKAQEVMSATVNSEKLVDSWDVDRFIKAQSNYFVWARLDHALEVKFNKLNPEDRIAGRVARYSDPEFTWIDHLENRDILETVEYWCEDMANDVWRGGSTWSGNGTANAINSIGIEAKRDLVDRHKRYLEMFEELKKAADEWSPPED